MNARDTIKRDLETLTPEAMLEAAFNDRLHPRDRRGQFIDVLNRLQHSFKTGKAIDLQTGPGKTGKFRVTEIESMGRHVDPQTTWVQLQGERGAQRRVLADIKLAPPWQTRPHEVVSTREPRSGTARRTNLNPSPSGPRPAKGDWRTMRRDVSEADSAGAQAVVEAIGDLEEWVGRAAAYPHLSGRSGVVGAVSGGVSTGGFNEKLHPRGRGGKFAKSLEKFAQHTEGDGPHSLSPGVARKADTIVSQAAHEDFSELSSSHLVALERALSLSDASDHYKQTVKAKVDAARKSRARSKEINSKPRFGAAS